MQCVSILHRREGKMISLRFKYLFLICPNGCYARELRAIGGRAACAKCGYWLLVLTIDDLRKNGPRKGKIWTKVNPLWTGGKCE
jgi:hypothetical protein